jgi:hypothetical protein
MTAVILPEAVDRLVGQLPAVPTADLDCAASYARAEKSPATRTAYKSDFNIFREWCAGRGVAALPATPQTVAAFLASEAETGLKPSTITRRCAAIRYAHKLADLEPPTNSEVVKATLRGIRRSVGAALARKAPVLAETARAMAFSVPDGLRVSVIARWCYWASPERFGARNWSHWTFPI